MRPTTTLPQSTPRTRAVVILALLGCGIIGGRPVGAAETPAGVTAESPARVAAETPASVAAGPGALAVTPPQTAAPSPETGLGGPPLDMRLAKIGRLQPGRGIRIWLPEGNLIDGRFLGSRRDSLLIATDRRTVSVPLPLVDALWIRQRATAKGAKIGVLSGTLAGGVIGGFLALVLQSQCDTGDCGGDVIRIIGGMTLIGAAGGAALGVAIGSQTWVWDRRYNGRP